MIQDHKFITNDEYNKILKFIKDSNIKTISLMGGEPTLHPYFRELTEIALNDGFNLSIKSNATWSEDVLQFLTTMPKNRVTFLLNINDKQSLGINLWRKVHKNVLQLKGMNVYLQINIHSLDFEYKHRVRLAAEIDSQLIWTLVVPSTISQKNKIEHPLRIGHGYTDRIVDMIIFAKKHNVNTIAVHGITPCMFNEYQLNILKDCKARIDSRCRPVFDIYPTLKVRYCFPLGDYVGSESITEHRNLQEINQKFISRLAIVRGNNFPAKECKSCYYALTDECGGGCLARRVCGELPREKLNILKYRAVLSRDFSLQTVRDKKGQLNYLLHHHFSNHSISINYTIFNVLQQLNDNNGALELSKVLINDKDIPDTIQQIVTEELLAKLVTKGVIILIASDNT